MDKTCSECTYLNLNSKDIYGKFYCDKRLEWHMANEEACYRFCNAYSRSTYDSRNAIEYSKDHSESGCYLTTMICDILGLPDNNIYLETLREFRNNVMQKDDKCKALLVEYDIVGPEIANDLNNDPANKIISKLCFGKYIVPITNLIKEKKNNEAINEYIDMTNMLKKMYSINNINISVDTINDADIKQSGHGIYKVKKITL